MTTITYPLPSFTALRTLAQTSPMARACLEIRKNQVRGAGWDIVPASGAVKAMQGSLRVMRDFGERRQQAVHFFGWPSGNYLNLAGWLEAALEDILVTDSLAIWLTRTREPGQGLLGGDIASLDLLNCALYLPVCDVRGQQVKVTHFGGEVRRCGMDECVIGAAAPVPPGTMEVGTYDSSELLYRRLFPRPWTLFGCSCLEQAVVCGEAGEIDLNATEARIPEKFGFTFTAPNRWEEIRDDHGKTLGDRILAWLKDSVFDYILREVCDAPDMQWAWEAG